MALTLSYSKFSIVVDLVLAQKSKGADLVLAQENRLPQKQTIQVFEASRKQTTAFLHVPSI